MVPDDEKGLTCLSAMSCHVAPPSMDRYTPAAVPTCTTSRTAAPGLARLVDGSMATRLPTKRVHTAFTPDAPDTPAWGPDHVRPSSAEMYTPFQPTMYTRPR